MFATCFQMLLLRVCIHAPTHAHLCPHRRRQARPLLSPFASQILSFVQTEALWQPRVQQVCRHIFPHFAHFMSLSYFANSHNVWTCSLLLYISFDIRGQWYSLWLFWDSTHWPCTGWQTFSVSCVLTAPSTSCFPSRPLSSATLSPETTVSKWGQMITLQWPLRVHEREW